MSVDDNQSETSERTKADYKHIKDKIRKITTKEKLNEYMLEHDEEMSFIPTPLLNSWVNVPNYKFFRHRGIL
jgi:hypothetical protein